MTTPVTFTAPGTGVAVPAPWTSAMVWVMPVSVQVPPGSMGGAVFLVPKDEVAGAFQTPSIFCSEWPGGVELVSPTPTSMLTISLAGPSVAVNEPS